jgi:glutamate 5-kinase
LIDFSNIKRIVLKIGSSTLTHPQGLINIRAIEQLIKVISDIKNSGKEIIIVSSGAVAVGMGKMGILHKSSDLPEKQAFAAIGQCELMYLYDKMFSAYHHTVAQILLTIDITQSSERTENVKNTFNRLIDMNVIPVVNENDSVCVEELMIGDNDNLSALVAHMTDADMLIILSDVDGLYTANPNNNPDAKLIKEVDKIDQQIHMLAEDSTSNIGTGGMITKIQAAQYAQENDISTFIISGKEPDLLYDLFSGKPVGTYFKKRSELND